SPLPNSPALTCSPVIWHAAGDEEDEEISPGAVHEPVNELPLSIEQVNVTVWPGLTVTRWTKVQVDFGASATMPLETELTSEAQFTIAFGPLLTTAEARTVVR